MFDFNMSVPNLYYSFYWLQVILVAFVVYFPYYIHGLPSILDFYDIMYTDLLDLIINNNDLILIICFYLKPYFDKFDFTGIILRPCRRKLHTGRIELRFLFYLKYNGIK